MRRIKPQRITAATYPRLMAEVERRLEVIGGPKTQSLRNAQGIHFREIITAYANAASGSTRYVAKTKSNVEQALDMITDPGIRATLRMALEEGKWLKVVNDNLHAAFKNIQVGASLGGRTTSPPVATQQTSAVIPIDVGRALSPRLLRALKKGIDSTWLAQKGLRINTDGSIKNELEINCFRRLFVTAIKSVLGDE